MNKTLPLICLLLALALALTGCGLSGSDYTYRKLSDGTVKITKYSGKAETLDIPSELDGKTVTGIGAYAFSDCVRLRSVTVPGSVKSIEEQAFLFCRSLSSVYLKEGLTEIGGSAFHGCEALTSVVIPEGVTSIGDTAFYCCTSLASVTIPGSVTHIGRDAFNVLRVGGGAFTAPIEGLTATVWQGSYAEEYCRQNGVKYKYPDD